MPKQPAPKLGDVRLVAIGLAGKRHREVWHLCERCQIGRWVQMRRGKPGSRICRKCSLAIARRIFAPKEGGRP